MKRDTKHQVTVEDLLRLKRAERPPEEFWTTFESELRAKQLAAIVVRRPLWSRASRLFAPFYCHSVSMGAVAALALAWVGVRYEGGSAQAPQIVSMAKVQPSVAAAPVRVAQVVQPVVAPPVQTATTVVAMPAPAPVAVASVSHVMQAPVTVQAEAASREPFAEGIQVTFADFRAAAPEAQHEVFGSDRDFEASVTPVRQQASEPLSQMDPSAERRARLLAPALPSYASAGASSLPRDWMKERSSDDRMYESMDLYGSNDRAVVGFRF
jgi:hypothetical protein